MELTGSDDEFKTPFLAVRIFMIFSLPVGSLSKLVKARQFLYVYFLDDFYPIKTVFKNIRYLSKVA